VLKFLKKVPMMKALADSDLRAIAKISHVREYGAGESIFQQFAPATHLFVVLEGRVKIFARSGGKKRKTFAYLRSGDFFGEMALLSKKPRSASAEAVEFTKLLIVENKDFQRLIAKNNALALALLRTVSDRLRQANEQIEGLLFSNILGRVAKTLYDLSKRGERRGATVVLPERYTQQELADLVGTTREPLTRAISSLRRAQVVELREERYVIKDTGKLEAICFMQP
jgi:CRP/FNR family transcriptional regulator, cyclic AMP receptor protein